MSGVDETILRQQKAMEEFERQRFSKETIEDENEQSIFQGEIVINKIPVKFEERKLFDGQIGIWMPDDFVALTEEEIAEIYLLGNKPELVFANSYLPISVGFHYTEHKVPNEYMGDFSKIVKIVLEKTGPKVRILSEKNKKIGNHMMSSLELISHSITETVYNLMFFSTMEEKVLMGFINFNYKYKERYKCIAQEILDSFRFIEEKESEEK